MYWDHYIQWVKTPSESHESTDAHNVRPSYLVITYVGNLDLVALLEMLGERFDEFLGGNVLDSNSTTGVDCRKLNLYKRDQPSLDNLTSILPSFLLMLILNNKSISHATQIYTYIFDIS
jgi:hypothetical protein